MSSFETSRIIPVRFNNTFRDFVQSAQGTNSDAREMVLAQANAANVGWHSIQVGGGTFFDQFAKKGRDPWEQNKILCDAFPGMIKTALVRGDCLFVYGRNPADLINRLVLEYGKMGMNRLSNFHGLNDTRMQSAVAKAALMARDAGYDIYAQGGICFEDNPNLTRDKAYRAAEQLLASGHKDFYLKCANGKAQPDEVFELVRGLKERFPQEDIYVHTHDTYGLAEAIYLAAIEAGADGIDVLPPYLAGNTAQPSALRMLRLIENHPSESVRARTPRLNIEAMMADEKAGLEFRFRYRGKETKFEAELLKAMLKAGVAGGASATLADTPGLKETLAGILRTTDWNAIQTVIYLKQAEIAAALGYPTQVTPYAKLTTDQAYQEIISGASGKPPLSVLRPDTVIYLTGGLGRVPDDVAPELQKEQIEFVTADELASRFAATEQSLAARGYTDVSEQDLITATLLSNPSKKNLDGINFVISKREGTLKPKDVSALPAYLATPASVAVQESHTPAQYDALVAQAIGMDHLEKLAQATIEIQKRGYYKTSVPDDCRPDGAFATEASLDRSESTEYLRAFFEQQYVEAEDYIDMIISQRIPEKLAQAGFTTRQAYALTQAVNRVIADVCAAKGVEKKNMPVFEFGLLAGKVLAVDPNYSPQQEQFLLKATGNGQSAVRRKEPAVNVAPAVNGNDAQSPAPTA